MKYTKKVVHQVGFSLHDHYIDLTIYSYEYFARIISFVKSTISTNPCSCISRLRSCIANILVPRMCLQHRVVGPASVEVYRSPYVRNKFRRNFIAYF